MIGINNDAETSIAPRVFLDAHFLSDLAQVDSLIRTSSDDLVLENLAIRREALGDLSSLSSDLVNATKDATSKARSLLEAHQRALPSSPLLSPISLFRAMGFSRQETSHTNSLAWLIDPAQPHGFDKSLLVALLQATQSDCIDPNIKNSILDPSSIIRKVSTEVPVRTGRIDILIEGIFSDRQPWNIVIEAKVDALERKAQLSGYAKSLSSTHQLRIFLTPSGHENTTSGKGPPWAPLSFAVLAKAFLGEYARLVDHPGASFLKLYITGVLQDICRVKCHQDIDHVLLANSPYELEALLGTTHEY